MIPLVKMWLVIIGRKKLWWKLFFLNCIFWENMLSCYDFNENQFLYVICAIFINWFLMLRIIFRMPWLKIDLPKTLNKLIMSRFFFNKTRYLHRTYPEIIPGVKIYENGLLMSIFCFVCIIIHYLLLFLLNVQCLAAITNLLSS